MSTENIQFLNIFKKLRGLIQYLFPIQCFLCGEILHNKEKGHICYNCLNIIYNEKAEYKRCKKCDKEINQVFNDCCSGCLSKVTHFKNNKSAVRYKYPFDNIIHSIKFSSNKRLCYDVADIMDRRLNINFDKNMVVTWVPISKKRLRKRGFNQAEEIARNFADRRNLRLENTMLKIKHTKPQAKLSLQKREIHKFFAYTSINLKNWNNKEIILIDDVYTTGTTADTCSKILISNGAKKVSVITFAHG